jgi:MtrB/PioB family decaheme-associated outer membrane protein
LLNPVPESLPFRLTGGFDIGGVGLPGGERGSPNLRTYRVIEEGFVASRIQLGIETKDQRWFLNFQGLDISKNDQDYQVSLGQYGRYRLDLEWDQIPHLYDQEVRSPYLRSEGGIYNLPVNLVTGFIPLSSCPAGPTQAACRLAYQQRSFNGSNVFDLKTRNDTGRGGFWWSPGSAWDLQLKYEHTRRAGNRPIGAGFNGSNTPIELPEPIEWQTDQLIATLGYSTPVWQLQGGYTLSIFGNDIKTMTYDNPFFNPTGCTLASTSVACARQARMVLAPDNQAHNWFVTGGLNLPMATRFTAKVAYGMNLQDDTFYAPTINNALLARNPGLSPSLFAPSLRGDVRTLLVNATGTSRPLPDLTVTGGYRFYGMNNLTLSQSFLTTAVRDTSTTGTRFSVPYDYQKQNADLDLAYKLFRPLTLRAGFGWERWDRPDSREVGQSDEYSAKFGVGYRPLSWLDIASRYTRSWKRIDHYDPYAPFFASELPQAAASPGGAVVKQRKYDEAARDRHKAELTFQFFPLENLEAGVTLAYAQDHFPWSYLGLISDKYWSGAVDVAYTPWSWLTLRANYAREEYHTKQRETPGGGVANPTLDWINRNVDTYDVAGAGTIIRLIPQRLEFSADYLFFLSVGKLHTYNPVKPSTAPANPTCAQIACDFPDDRFSRQRIITALRYWLLKNLSLRAGYTYERFRESYWQSDFIQPMNTISGLGTATEGVYLGARPYKNYEVHIISGGVSYGF